MAGRGTSIGKFFMKYVKKLPIDLRALVDGEVVQTARP
jgi:hypothetical protein